MSSPSVRKLVGSVPNRLQLAGGWIDQPFVSRHNPKAPGSMVVVQIEADFLPMERSGLASGTRHVAARLWKGRIPKGDPAALVQDLYQAENAGKSDPSGSQDMIGLVYPGINRLDYDYEANGGVFPTHIASCNKAKVARWLEKHLHLLPIEPRPPGYSPLARQNLDPRWIARLGEAGRRCFDAITRQDADALGASLNLNMRCWETILPDTLRHPVLRPDLPDILRAYQKDYAGAMFSGCGGGYLLVVSPTRVPGSLHVHVRTAQP